MDLDIFNLIIGFSAALFGVYLRHVSKTKNFVWFLGSLKRRQKITISQSNGKCPKCGYCLNGRHSDVPKNNGDNI